MPPSRLLLPILLTALAARGAPVDLRSAPIVVEGAWFVQRTADGLHLARHTDAVLRDGASGVSAASLPYARTQSGVRLRFRTDSTHLALRFRAQPDGAQLGYAHGFALYANGRPLAHFDSASWSFKAPASGVVDYELVLPSYQSVELAGIDLDDGHVLLAPAPDRRPVYVAIGDSITAGLGQQSASDASYPFLLAQARGWNLVNLGISGSTIGPAMAQLLAGRRADVITVALGVNDWYWHADSLATRATAYAALLAALRRAQPHALIVAITPLATAADPALARAPYSLDQLCARLGAVVAQRRAAGDRRLHLLAGARLSEPAMLIDGLHLSVDGAARYAAALQAALPALRTSPSR